MLFNLNTNFSSQNYSIHYWLDSGAPAEKLVLGMPLYGQSFTLDTAKVHGLNAPARQKGRAGEFTKAPGFLAYYEICQKVKEENWRVVQDSEGRMGPYAYKVGILCSNVKEIKGVQIEGNKK